MTKVHPHATAVEEPPRPESPRAGGGRAAAEATVLTVWRKSLLFNGNGFTVFDSKGHLVFRVDNYSSGSRDCIVLMDAAGKPLLTIRRKVPNTPTPTPPSLIFGSETVSCYAFSRVSEFLNCDTVSYPFFRHAKLQLRVSKRDVRSKSLHIWIGFINNLCSFSFCFALFGTPSSENFDLYEREIGIR